jgi:AhpD family alkylhydroperoxidase
MSYLHSLPPDAGLLRIFQAFPETARPLLEYHDVLLRRDSAFTAGERELVAAYVSALNNCSYCHAVHSQTAVALGISANVMANVSRHARKDASARAGTPRCGVRTSQRDVPTNDFANAGVDLRMQPVLAFVCKLTLSPGEIVPADVDVVFAAGWDDRAVHDAIAICGLFNLMNRLVNGLGVEAPETYTKMAAQRLAEGGYAKLLEFLPASK